jgi:hypothetical protein
VKVALRDDDTCFFTSPEDARAGLSRCVGSPAVCLATVPFAIGYERKGIPEEHWHSGVSFPLEQNAAWCRSSSRQIGAGRVTIALHGYTHEDYPDGFEFQSAPDPERRLAHGLGYLQETLAAPITLFVPPHNALSKRGLSAVSGAGLNLLGSFLSFRPSMRPVGCAHAGQLVAGTSLSIGNRPFQGRSLRVSARSPLPAALGVWLPQPDPRNDRRGAHGRL